MMAAVLAHGKTVLKNAAMEPEIGYLAEYLNSCGAKVSGAGTTTIEIEGLGGHGQKNVGNKNLLESKGKPFITPPDRIETGSFMFLGVLCASDLKITHCDPLLLEIPIMMLRESVEGSGITIETGKDFIHIKSGVNPSGGKSSGGKIASLKPMHVRTHEYPGFATDLQAPLAVYLTQTTGDSTIFETIFESRLKYTDDLKKMGADITILNPREILIKGPAALKATDEEPLEAYDLRAGFAIVMAALIAKGASVVKKVYYIDRGYEHLEVRLKAIGADIQRISEEVEL
jgi:UDP-N-acetylglucosamine 1-carboxyvinyltransferase